MKNTFEAIYQQIEELKARYQIAKSENNVEAMDQVKSERNAIHKSLIAMGGDFEVMYDYYEASRKRGNEYIDICECYEYSDEAALIASLRACGIDTFTFSSRWSSAVESAWKFVQNGCSLMCMVEINSKTTKRDSDEYEKCPAYLFKVN
jgi:hypothetical protein